MTRSWIARFAGPARIALAGICAASAAEATPTFTDVTAQSGLKAIRDAKPSDWWLSGLTFVDLDHDGDLDLFLADHEGSAGTAVLNDGRGNFALAGGSYPTTEVHLCLDADEDGKVDMDMTYEDGGAKWWLNQTAEGSSSLNLVDVGDVDTRDGNESRSEALVDLNRDGKLDWVRGCQGQNFKVDFGDGKGHFAEDSMLIAQPEGNALDAGMMFADLDGDGDEDMIVNWGGYSSPDGNDYGRARILINDGNGNLVEKTTEVGLPADHLAILGIGDVDQDGDVDLIGLDNLTFPEVIYLNDGHGSFSAMPNAVTGVTGTAEYALWGLGTVTDLDNDGIADILIDGRYFFHVLRGTGGGHFVYQNDAWGKITNIAEGSVDSGFAFGDIDGDGDLDLMGYTAGDPDRQIALYRNDLPAQNWVNIRPRGLPGNRAGISSKIRVYEAGTDHLLWFEEVSGFSKQAQQNYYAFDALERHYGLGSRATVDVTVTFTPSGTVVRKNGVAANTTVLIGEAGTNGVVEPPTPTTSPDSGAPNSAGGTTEDGGGFASGGSSRGGSSPTGRGGASPSGAGGSSHVGASGTASGGNASGTSGSEPSPGASSAKSSGCGCHVDANDASGGARTMSGLVSSIVGLSWALRRRSRRRAAG